MGRRDNDGKRKSWTIEAGDWEKLYAAFIRAKEKNNLLDVRLGRQLTDIEKQRLHRDSSLFNDIFEQKQLVFKYKQEVKDIKKDANRRAQQTARYDALSYAIRRRDYEKFADAGVADTVTTAPAGSVTERNPHVQSVKLASDDALPAANQQTTADDKRTADADNATKQEKPAEPPTEPPAPLPGRLTKSSTMPNLTVITEPQEEKPQKLDIVTAEYWVGDPVAIRSVRRPRLQPSEMSDRAQTYGQTRKMMVSIPKYPMCSRNCNKPGAGLEALMPDSSLLPRIRLPVVKRHLTQLSHSLDSLPSIALKIQSRSGEDVANTDVVGSACAHPTSTTDDVNHLPPIQEALNTDVTSFATDSKPNVVVTQPNAAMYEAEKIGDSVKSSAESVRTSKQTLPKTEDRRHIAPCKTSSGSSGQTASHVRDIVEANKELTVNAPVEVLARVKTGNLCVTSLTDTTRQVSRNMDEAQHRSITSRHDTVVVDKSSQFKRHRVKKVIRYSPTKASRELPAKQVMI